MWLEITAFNMQFAISNSHSWKPIASVVSELLQSSALEDFNYSMVKLNISPLLGSMYLFLPWEAKTKQNKWIRNWINKCIIILIMNHLLLSLRCISQMYYENKAFKLDHWHECSLTHITFPMPSLKHMHFHWEKFLKICKQRSVVQKYRLVWLLKFGMY